MVTIPIMPTSPCCENVEVTGQNEQKRGHRSDISWQGKRAFCGQKRAYPIGSPVCAIEVPPPIG